MQRATARQEGDRIPSKIRTGEAVSPPQGSPRSPRRLLEEPSEVPDWMTRSTSVSFGAELDLSGSPISRRIA
jgi:hypothetical protein